MSRGDVAAGRQDLVDFLRTAPPHLRGWAERELAALAPGDASPAGEASPAGDAPERFHDSVADVFDEDLADGLSSDGATGPDGAAGSRGGRGTVARRRVVPRWLRRRAVLTVVALAVVAVLGVVVYRSGGSAVPGLSGTPSDTASAGPSATVDQGKVAALMQTLGSAPRDVTTLTALGDLYFQAGDYPTAAIWQQKALDAAPTNVTARLALGASQFNRGDSAGAERQWQQVVAQDPENAEAHYDLGFLYLSENPPNVQKVRQEWEKVVRIDPNSPIAKTVATHLQSLQSPSPSASASAPAAP